MSLVHSENARASLRSAVPWRIRTGSLAQAGDRHWKLSAFLTGLGSQLFVRLIGYLAFTEVFFLATLPFKVWELFAAAVCTPSTTIFTALWLLWVIGSVVADFVNGSQFDLMARGVSRSLFLGFDVICLLAMWLRRPEKVEYFMLAYPISFFISKFAFRSGADDFLGGDTADFSNWKSHTSYVVAGVLYAVVARYYRRAPLLIAALTVATGVFFTAMGSRSFGLTQVLAGMLMVAFPGGSQSRASDLISVFKKRRTLIFKIFVGLLVGLATIYGTGKAYKVATRQGYLGDKELRKLEEQESTKGGMLVGGRLGFFVGIWAGCHKPLLGHGSWPLDTYGYTQQVMDYFEVYTAEAKAMTKKLYWIPSHSALIGGWVEHGIFGLLFWVFILYLVIVNFPRAAIVFPAQAGLYALIFADMFWSVLFSPAGHRVFHAAKIVCMLLVDEAWRRQTRDVREGARAARIRSPNHRQLRPGPEPA